MSRQGVYDDWTGNVVADATLRSLDPEAVRAARASFMLSNRDHDSSMGDEAFLTEAGLVKRGRITNTAMILLGKVTENVLPQSVCIRWKLVDTDGIQSDMRVFRGPAVLTVRQAVSMIRNSTLTVGGDHGRRQVSAYRLSLVLEAVMNAVVHQDFSFGGTVDIIEREYESVTVVSRGSFPNVNPESFAQGNVQAFPPRNPFLFKAAAGLGLIPGNGSGIRGMYLSQIYNHLPLPCFAITEDTVSVTFMGIRRGNYCRMLDMRDDIDVSTALDLDRVDRGLYVPDSRLAQLERRKLVKAEGGMVFLRSGPGPEPLFPHGTDRQAVAEMAVSHGSVDRSSVAAMLRARDTKGLSEEQLRVKATNLIQGMCKSGILVRSEGSTKSARYSMKKDVRTDVRRE